MAETATAPAVTPEVQPVVAKPEPDLITKVSQFKKPEATPSADPELANFDYKRIETIKDPEAKKILIDYYKDEQRKFTKKFQDLASEKKSLEAERNTPWTPEKINQLLSDQSFLQAAQQVTQTQSAQPTEGSLLSEEEQARLAKVGSLEAEMLKIKQESLNAVIAQKDTELKNRFSDYDPIIVDNGIRDLSRLPPQEIRPYVWKAVNYERDIQRAYELGKQEKNDTTKDKINSLTSPFGSASPANDLPTREKGESSQDYFLKLAQRRLEESKKK